MIQAETEAMKNILHVEAEEEDLIQFAIHYTAPSPTPSSSSPSSSSSSPQKEEKEKEEEKETKKDQENDNLPPLLPSNSLKKSENYSRMPYDAHFSLKMRSVRVMYVQPFFNFLLWYYYETDAIQNFVYSRLVLFFFFFFLF